MPTSEPASPPAGGMPRRAGASRARNVGLYPLLILLPLLLLLPMLGYSGALLYLLAEQGRDSTRRELVAANHALAAVVQRELDHHRMTLNLMARSTAFATPQPLPERVLHLMRTVVESEMGLQSLALLDVQGRVLLEHPPRPGGAPRRVALGPHHRQLLETRQPVVSDLYRGSLSEAQRVSINVPVMHGNEVRWILAGQVQPDHLARTLNVQLGAREAIATVMDGQMRIVARTSGLDQFYGLLPSPATQQAVRDGPQGVRRIVTLDGNEYLWAWSTVDSGWTIFFGIPAQTMDQALRDSMIRLALMGLVVLLLGLGTTVLVARRITRSVDRMATNADRMIDGESPPYRASGIRQLDALYQALARARGQVVQALSDRDQALAAERAARALADEDNRAKDVFIATLSHELRNPLAPIRSATRMLRTPGVPAARQAWAAEVIERQAGAMSALLDDLLDISRVTSGRIVLERQLVTLDAVIDAAVETARPLLDARQHEFHAEMPSQAVWLDADPLRLAQVFSNLLTNAAKYTDPGGHITLSAQVAGDEVQVRLRDNGIGIDPQELDRVFQMFTQVRGPLDRSQGGLGIGLSLVRGLVELHGGWVRAESEGLGRGSTFVVGLPLASGPAPEAA